MRCYHYYCLRLSLKLRPPLAGVNFKKWLMSIFFSYWLHISSDQYMQQVEIAWVVEIECFECNSWEDPRCHDPFNYTVHKHHMPPVRECEGCCVKMVQFIGTEHYQIKRTCTDDFDVNFFMVNHACMTEGHRHGHMCFCEEDECNTASSNLLQQPLTTLGIPLALTLLLGAFPR